MRNTSRRRAVVWGVAPVVAAVVAAGTATPAVAAEADAGGPTTRLVVVADGPGQATSVAGRLDVLGQGLTVVDPDPSGRTLTVEVPTASVAALVPQIRAEGHVAEVVPETTYELFDAPNDPEAEDDEEGALRAVKLLPDAWDITHGSAAVRIAVIDTGVAVNHPDLVGKVVDTYDATTGESAVPDDDGHGTLVASIAGAATNNGIGIAGSGWNSSILAVKVADADDVITNSAVADGIDWAVAHSADVINLSLGSTVNDLPVREAVARAVAADVVVVAAAGNGASSTKFYPAALPDVLAVGATTFTGTSRASFSEYGSWVDVGAPGVTMIGANAAWATGADYVTGDGTSFASPFVAGAVALIRASRPELDESAVQNAVTTTATSQSFGFGHGLLNAYAALGVGLVLPGPTVDSPLPGASVLEQTTVAVTVPAGVDADHVKIELLGAHTILTPPIESGQASAILNVSGSYGPDTIRVTLCRQTLCSATGTDVAIDVTNPAPVITDPADGARFTSGFQVGADSPGRSVRFLADGVTVLGTRDTGNHFAVDVPLSALSPGQHILTAVECDQAGVVCATDHPSAPVSITLARLSPSITGLSADPFSPNGDGDRDVTTVTYALDVDSDVTVHFQDAGGHDVRTRALGVQAAGTHSVAWGGFTDAAVALPSGTYTVVLDTSATVDAEVLHGQDTRTVVIDLHAPTLSAPATTYPTVYPSNDDYRDSTLLSVVVGESARTFAVTVLDSHNKKVFAASRTSTAAGRVGLNFSGHSTAGAKLPAGTYHYQLRVRDVAGNLSVTGLHTVSVSWKKLVAKTFTKTVTAKVAGDGTYFTEPDDTCSHVTAYSSGALRWQSCGGPVETLHHITLPKATVYGAARISAHGHGGTGAVAHFGYLAEDDNTVTGEVAFSATNGTHSAGPVHVTAALLKGRDLRWLILVEDGDAYLIETFSVVFHYSVLA